MPKIQLYVMGNAQSLECLASRSTIYRINSSSYVENQTKLNAFELSWELDAEVMSAFVAFPNGMGDVLQNMQFCNLVWSSIWISYKYETQAFLRNV